MSELTAAEKFIWEWQMCRMSDFKRALLSLIMTADVQNLEKLRLGFPDEVEGWIDYKQIDGWWDKVEKKVEDMYA